jgi:capsular exopolysaccharide synthesis family protein
MSVDVGLPLLGTLPVFQTPGRPLLAGPGSADADCAGVFADCVDAARARLVYAGRERGVRVVLVTSAVGGEGKTTLATNLAVSLARTGRKTVLLDGDMRRPAVHNYFGLLMGFGFSELLRGQARLGDALQPSGVEDLWVITAGQGDESSSRALARAAWSSLLTQLREQFEFVVIDSAPVLPLVDSLLLAQQSDAVILSARRLVSRMTSVEAARQRLQEVGVPVLGVVLTAARVQSYGYRYPPGYAATPAAPDGEAANAL